MLLATRDRTGKAKVEPPTIHPDQQRVSSLINDKLQERLLAGNKEPTQTLDIKAPQTQVVDFSVVTPVHFARGHSQRKDSHCCYKFLQTKKIKICERCFLCHSIVFCKTCNKCPNCCLKSACRGQDYKTSGKLG